MPSALLGYKPGHFIKSAWSNLQHCFCRVTELYQGSKDKDAFVLEQNSTCISVLMYFYDKRGRNGAPLPSLGVFLLSGWYCDPQNYCWMKNAVAGLDFGSGETTGIFRTWGWGEDLKIQHKRAEVEEPDKIILELEAYSKQKCVSPLRLVLLTKLATAATLETKIWSDC